MFRRFSRLLSLSLSLSRFFMRHQYGLEGRGVGGLRAPRLGVDLFTQIITQKESTAGRFSARAREKKRERERERVSTFHSQPMLTPPQPLPPSSPSSSSSPSLYFFFAFVFSILSLYFLFLFVFFLGIFFSALS